MAIIYSNTTLCSHSLAVGRIGPSAFTVNGRQVNDVVAYLRAPAVTVFPRGGRSHEVSFRVYGSFSTIIAAQQYAALHFGQLPPQGDLIETDDADNPLWTLPDACIAGLRTGRNGLGVYLEYAFTGGAFESEDINLPDGESDLVKAKRVALTSGEIQKAFTWDSPFATTPRGVFPGLIIPDDGGSFGIVIPKTSLTAEGGIMKFDAAVPGDGYEVALIGVL